MTCLVLFQICCAGLQAAPTSLYQAEKVVQGWLNANMRPLGVGMGQKIIEVETFSNADGKPVYYVVYLQPSGFVIVSADDLIEPIIGFAANGTYNPSNDNPLGTLVSRDLPGRIATIRSVQTPLASRMQLKGIATPQTVLQEVFLKARDKWAKLQGYAKTMPRQVSVALDGEKTEYELRGIPKANQDNNSNGLDTLSDIRVAPLIESKWSQSVICDLNPVNCYNYYTPNNYVCGCVATAMVQVMRFHQYPTTGIGVHTFEIFVDGSSQNADTRGGDGSGGPYKWDLMELEPNCETSLAQREAIGALCYDAGAAVYMDYSANWSGAYYEDAKDALIHTFGYSNVILGGEEQDSIGSGLTNMLNPNLDAGYPTLLGIASYSNYSETAHAIICDGYGYNFTTIYHHLNMGWAGSDDAWYNLPDIGGDYNYDLIDECIYNIFTVGSGEIISGRVIDLSDNHSEYLFSNVELARMP